MILTCLAAALLGPAQDASISRQIITVQFAPERNHVLFTYRAVVDGVGSLIFRLHPDVQVKAVLADREEVLITREPADDGSRHDRITVNLTGDESRLDFLCEAVLRQDVSRGERAGVIHNHSVNAHIGPEGVFLSDGSAWHPQWIDEGGVPHLLPALIEITPLDGWAFVCSGDPAGEAARPRSNERPATEATGQTRSPERAPMPRPAPDDLARPIWTWETPRGVDGVAVVGNRHVLKGITHDTIHGPVEIVTHFSDRNAPQSDLYLDAAASYLDLYVPLLGPFPYQRFSIVENFFSSGFAYPGFTLLGPQVVAMGERSLAPGYLDHELVHNWWGNGVYVDPRSGNWCEALTSYCANYFRRVHEGGEPAGREYRRGIIMRASADPSLDNGPVGRFGVDAAIDRFVGYDKGSFVFMMLEHGPGIPPEQTDRTAMFAALKRFAAEFMGRRATWNDLRRTIEAEWSESRADFFARWIDSHNVPRTPAAWSSAAMGTFRRDFFSGDELLDVGFGRDEQGAWREIDPGFLVYRLLPPEQVIPTLAGTLGPGGMRVAGDAERPEFDAFLPRVNHDEKGENLLLIGAKAIAAHRALIERAANAIAVRDGSFTLGDAVFADPEHAVLHTMPHPDQPGRFITIFHANGDAGWSRLRLITFYTRDSTIVWKDEQVIDRRVFEPSRRLRVNP